MARRYSRVTGDIFPGNILRNNQAVRKIIDVDHVARKVTYEVVKEPARGRRHHCLMP